MANASVAKLRLSPITRETVLTVFSSSCASVGGGGTLKKSSARGERDTGRRLGKEPEF